MKCLMKRVPHKKKRVKLAFLEIRVFRTYRDKVETKTVVTHRNTHQSHQRTQSVLTRPPHLTRLTGSLKPKLPTFNLTQGKTVDSLRTTTSHFDVVGMNLHNMVHWMQWIPEQIVGIGEDFHRQVDDVKVTTTLYKVRWIGYDRTGDTWEPITL
jgi:hypothetical protein